MYKCVVVCVHTARLLHSLLARLCVDSILPRASLIVLTVFVSFTGG